MTNSALRLAAGGLVFGLLLVALPALSGPLTTGGTQPPVVNEIRSHTDCRGCHGDYDSSNHIEPHPTWAGSMMAQSARDPLFWAALDVANNDLPGAGDFCLRCHTPGPWLEGIAEPPDGSTDGCTLSGKIDEDNSDFQGINCHYCHRMMVNSSPPAGESPLYLENGIISIDDESCSGGGGGQPCRHGPYDYPADGSEEPPHPWIHDPHVESAAYCGACHNVTNPVLNLIVDGVDTGIPFPIERTYDEWLNSDFGDPLSAEFAPCQSCHMPDATVSPAYACDDRRNDHSGDLPIHELAGGNTWIPDVLDAEYPELNITEELAATRDAAEAMLTDASAEVDLTAPASVSAGTDLALSVRVTNLTGHKLPTGYPEGRRMWLRVVVRDGESTRIFVSGAYSASTGALTEDAQAKIYRTEPGVWDFNGTGECDVVDGGGSPIFHFVLNNCLHLDNRIPPLGFVGGTDPEIAPVGYVYPETSPGSGVLANYDDTAYTVPVPSGTTGPLSVTAQLLYQTASREYVEFLWDEAVTNAFPDDCVERRSGFPTSSRGELLHDMWSASGRSAPVVMATATASVTVGAGAVCGDGTVDPGETCDPPGSCPTACDDGDACTADTLVGSADECTAECTAPAITACTGGDGCCPSDCYADTDSDCTPDCGNSVVEPGETCDPPGSCPSVCDDGVACTTDALTGSAAGCTASCTATPITECSDGDGCCPGGCDATTDDDCSASCGNSVLEPGETCDPPESCPSACDDGVACTIDTLTGSAAACSAACSHATISECHDGDGCCPAGCDATTDDDCSASCGNSVVEPGETCGMPESCDTDCDDGLACTIDTLTGSAASCSAACSNSPISECHDGDGCCAGGCDSTVDGDCSASCGNSVVEAGETCDPPESCDTDCDDGVACTIDALTGSAAACSAACSHSTISECHDGDGCCPAGCDSTVDEDCSATCGDSVIDAGETCDPPESCPTGCDDENACTVDTLTGSAASCSAACSNTPISECHAGDGCCPAGCDATVDDDCSATCGDSVLDAGETCDPPESCPSDCDDDDACTVDTLTGSAETCSAACSNAPISACDDGDGCCPAGCDFSVDDDCSPSCGNGLLNPGETCDPPESCPVECDDGDACTIDTLAGSASSCTAACMTDDVGGCMDGDGCCPEGCDGTTDDDCVAEPSEGGGCSCRVSPRDLAPETSSLLALWALTLLRLRRRR